MDESPRKVEHAKSTGPERIWLSPCCDPERSWCQDAVFEVCDCGAAPVAYLRADLAAPKTAAASADPAADLVQLIAWHDAQMDAAAEREDDVIAQKHSDTIDAIERLLRERDAARYLLKRMDEVRANLPDWEKLWAEQTERAEKADADLDAAIRERDDLMRRLKGIEDVGSV